MINQCFTNDTVTFHYDATRIGYSIRRIKPYKSDTNIEDITTEKNMYDGVNI